MKWLHVLPIPDLNRHVPDRYIPFPLSRNTGLGFPSTFSVPVSVPEKKAGTVLEFSRPFSSVHVASSGPSGVAIGDGPEKSRKRSEQRSTRRREFPNVRRLTYPSVRRLTYPNFLKIDLKITHFL